VGKRQRKAPPTPEEKLDAENWFPGSGLSSEVPLGFSVERALPTQTDFRAVPTDMIRAEMEYQERALADYARDFPRVVTGTIGELSPVEKQVLKKMEAHHTNLELLKLELASRNEIPATPIILPKSDAMPGDHEEFNHSADYRSIRWQGSSYLLTPRQAQIVQILHEAYIAGTPELSNACILEKLEATTSRLRDSFKGTDLWGTGKMIIPCERRGMYRLNLPDPAR
jgi:hypothetical protein